MPLIANRNCQIQDTVHQGICTIIDGLSTLTKIDGQFICLDGLKVQVSGGTVPGPQVSPIVITLNANVIQNIKFDNKKPLALGEVSSGTDMAQYQVGSGTVSLPVTITIIEAGQNKVSGQ